MHDDFGVGALADDLSGATPPPAATPPPTEPAPPAATPPPPAATPPAPADPTYPWTEWVNAEFADEGVRAKVSEGLRTKYAPYVTQLEQERVDLRGKAQLYEDLSTDPGNTLRDVAVELYGDEMGAKIADALGLDTAIDTLVDEPPAAVTAAETDTEKWVREQREKEATQQAVDSYNRELAAELAAHPNKDHINTSVLHRYVATTAQGDVKTAIAQYLADFPPGAASAPAAPGESAPPTLTGAASSTPQAPAAAPQTMKEAGEAMFAALRDPSWG